MGSLHARIYNEHPGSDLVGVCDIDRERADQASKLLGVPAFYDLKDMIDAASPSIISVATGGEEYGSDHMQPTVAALEAGCHVLVEKPISNEIADAEAMVEAARRTGRCLGVNLNHRFTPMAERAKRWIEEGRLGHLLFVNVSMWIMNPRESSPWFHLKALHPHTVDLMRYFCGEITHVHCFATKAPGRSIWSTAQFNMRFENGVVGSLTGSYDIERGHPMERCEVAGTGARFVLEDIFQELTLYRAGDERKYVITNSTWRPEGMRDFSDTFRHRLIRFVDQVAAGTPPEEIEASGFDGLQAQKVIAAAIRSIENSTVEAV